MTEVHRYQVVTMLSAAGATIGYDPHGPEVVMASAFDEATQLFLDAAERCVASERREKELQRRLTAADERADVLEGLLWEYVDRGEVTNEWARDWLLAVTTALKPAEGGGDEPNCLLCLDKKTVPSNLAEGYVMDCPDCCGEEG